MRPALRLASAFVLSASLILTPLYALRAFGTVYASGTMAAQQTGRQIPRKLAPHEPGTLLVKFRPEAKTQSQYLLHTFGKTQQALRGNSGVIRLTLKDDLDFTATMDTLRQLDGAVEWVEPNYLVKRASVGSSSSHRAGKSATHRNASRDQHA